MWCTFAACYSSLLHSIVTVHSVPLVSHDMVSRNDMSHDMFSFMCPDGGLHGRPPQSVQCYSESAAASAGEGQGERGEGRGGEGEGDNGRRGGEGRRREGCVDALMACVRSIQDRAKSYLQLMIFIAPTGDHC